MDKVPKVFVISASFTIIAYGLLYVYAQYSRHNEI